MKLLLPHRIAVRLTEALRTGGHREVGGVLMGEHVDVGIFRVVDVTTQMKGGTFARFVRLVEAFTKPLRAFFQATHHEYAKFNYMGEWHSHHSFALKPSSTDHRAMFDILQEPEVGARFAVLLLVKLGSRGELQTQLTVYELDRQPAVGTVVPES